MTSTQTCCSLRKHDLRLDINAVRAAVKSRGVSGDLLRSHPLDRRCRESRVTSVGTFCGEDDGPLRICGFTGRLRDNQACAQKSRSARLLTESVVAPPCV